MCFAEGEAQFKVTEMSQESLDLSVFLCFDVMFGHRLDLSDSCEVYVPTSAPICYWLKKQADK